MGATHIVWNKASGLRRKSGQSYWWNGGWSKLHGGMGRGFVRVLIESKPGHGINSTLIFYTIRKHNKKRN